MKYEVLEALNDGEALIVATARDGRSATWIVTPDGEIGIDPGDEAAPSPEEGWPTPPQRYIREAVALAAATAQEEGAA